MNYRKRADQAGWRPHPSGAPGIEINVLRSASDDNAQETIMFVRVAAGATVPAHVHDQSDDNLYILEGQATMRVAGDTFALEPGDQVTVPAGVEHEIYDVTADVVIYDVFAPPTM